MIIIGVVGPIAAGKGVFVECLKNEFNFVSFSLSTIVHEELEKKNIKKFTRETMQEIGNGLRRENGDDVLARRALEYLKKQKSDRIVIEGIRNPGEIKFLKKNSSFVSIGIKTSRKLRFERMSFRNKPWDPKNWNDFVKVDKNDLGIGQNNSGQQVGKCLDYCDFIITNNKNKHDFIERSEKLIKKILSK